MPVALRLAVLALFCLPAAALSAADEVDLTPLSVRPVPALTELEIARPIVLTHAGDGSRRTFVASQLGKIFVVPPGDGGAKASLLVDLEPKVRYANNENEEGLLGLALHPKFKENGRFFVYYTTRSAPHTSVISHFQALLDGGDISATEQELLRIPQPYWNHNGGGLAFGPDGFLYIALGDGGSANDPQRNGQNLGTLLGSILRIDIDHHDPGRAYAIPRDNPFVDREGARPEIYAYGVRNIWGMSFDRRTGTLWAADVGQDIWEEINLIVRGGNYGWNLREAKHPFGPQGSPPRPDLIDPIWEYHHDVGKSITGGYVYRGKMVPELAGLYVYGDYVTGRLWALGYDPQAKKVTANRLIAGNRAPVMAFGEDEDGEIYFTRPEGRIFRLAANPNPDVAALHAEIVGEAVQETKLLAAVLQKVEDAKAAQGALPAIRGYFLRDAEWKLRTRALGTIPPEQDALTGTPLGQELRQVQEKLRARWDELLKQPATAEVLKPLARP